MSGKPFTIRRSTEADVEAIAHVHMASIHTQGAQAYDAEIVAEWGAPRDGSRYAQAMDDGETMFVAVALNRDGQEQVLGFSSHRIADGQHRTAVYIDGKAARQGVGRQLLAAAVEVARVRGAREIHINASLNAVAFYRANGFAEIAPGDHKMRSGRLMPCMLMKKMLLP